MSMRGMVTIGPVCLLLGACATDGTPIVAGAVDQIGVSISGGPQEQGGNLTVGYRGAKFAVVPVENRRGDTILMTDAKGGQRSFSVFAMLGLDTRAGASPLVGIQQVVAVGPAAEIWANKAPAVMVDAQGVPIVSR